MPTKNKVATGWFDVLRINLEYIRWKIDIYYHGYLEIQMLPEKKSKLKYTKLVLMFDV